MKMTCTETVTLKTQDGRKVFSPGDVFEADEEKARPFIEKGILRKIEEITPKDSFQVKDFKNKNIAVRIRSTVVENDLWLVSNEDVREHLKAEGLVCYLPEEILHMRNLPPEGIKAIHAIKQEFGGTTQLIKNERGKHEQ